MSIDNTPEITGHKDFSMMLRLLAYLKKYKLPVIIALVSLIMSTVAELSIPVVLQGAIDQHLLPQYNYLQTGTPADAQEVYSTIKDETRVKSIQILGTGVFMSVQDIQTLSRDRNLPEWLQNIIHTNLQSTVYIPSTTNEELVLKLTEKYGAEHRILGEANQWLIPQELYSLLSPEEKELLRATSIRNLGISALTLLLLLFISLVFTFGQIYYTAKAGQGVMKELRMDLFGHMMKQRMGYIQDIPVGTIISRVTNDVETINELFTSVLTGLIKDVAIMIGVVFTLFLLNAQLAWVAIATLPPVLVVTMLFRSKAREAYRNVRHWVSEVNRYLSEHLSGMPIIHAFAKEEKVSREFDEKNTSLMKANLGEMYVFATFRPLVDLFATTSAAIIIYFGARYYLSSTISLGILIAFINLIRKFYEPVMDMSEKFTILQSAMSGSERVFTLMDHQDYIPETSSTTIDIEGIRGEIRFDNVHFSYKPDEPVLRGLSFTAKPGQKIAIVGSTGAGKTTIANLITRLWDIQEGTIWLDGVPVTEYTLNDLRSAVQPIQQEISLFSESIRENILLGKNLTDQEIWNILDIVQAKDFIQALPEGLDTILNEQATNLSTGQRQLLAFARILAQNPRVIILDEATANIDTETETRIQKALKAVLQGRTSLIIAHRLSTIKDSDSILVLSHGHLVEQGSHNALLEAKGLYSRLYHLQFEHGHSG